MAALPHLNQLADEFRHGDVVFVAITDDAPDRLKPFLAQHPIKAIIGIDPERKTWKSFGVPSIPHAVLIGTDGHIVGSTSPEKITSDDLRQALAGKNPVLPKKEGIPMDLEWDDHLEWPDGIRPDMYAIIKPIKTLTSGAKPKPGHLTADGAPLEALVWLAYQTNSFHMDWRMPNDEQTYRVAFRVPEGREDRLFPYLRETLSEMFAIEAHWTEQPREVYVLRQIVGRPPLPESRADKDIAQMTRGRITLQHEPISKLCTMLTGPFNSIVLDETGMKGFYDFELPYAFGQVEVTSAGLSKFGLQAVRERRDVSILVVTPQPNRTTDTAAEIVH